MTSLFDYYIRWRWMDGCSLSLSVLRYVLRSFSYGFDVSDISIFRWVDGNWFIRKCVLFLSVFPPHNSKYVRYMTAFVTHRDDGFKNWKIDVMKRVWKFCFGIFLRNLDEWSLLRSIRLITIILTQLWWSLSLVFCLFLEMEKDPKHFMAFSFEKKSNKFKNRIKLNWFIRFEWI